MNSTAVELLISISKNNATYSQEAVVEQKWVMSGVLKIEISESVERLQELLSQQKIAKMQQRIQVLYWLKTKQAETVDHLATLVGRHRTTVSRWLSEYRAGGLAQLLNIQTSPGRTRKIPPAVEAKLREELKDPQGFSSYKEIQVWLKAMCDLDVGYTVAHKLVRYRLKALVKSAKTRSHETKRRSSRRV